LSGDIVFRAPASHPEVSEMVFQLADSIFKIQDNLAAVKARMVRKANSKLQQFASHIHLCLHAAFISFIIFQGSSSPNIS
jgi:hypothetical protein